MSALVELAQAARLHRAEDRWLAACADRLRLASRPRTAPQAPTAENVEAARATEAVR